MSKIADSMQKSDQGSESRVKFLKNCLALLFERFSDGSVEIYFRNGTEESNFFDLTQEVCQKVPCTISDLEEAWRDVIPLNWDAECHNMDPSPEGLRKMSKIPQI